MYISFSGQFDKVRPVGLKACPQDVKAKDHAEDASLFQPFQYGIDHLGSEEFKDGPSYQRLKQKRACVADSLLHEIKITASAVLDARFNVERTGMKHSRPADGTTPYTTAYLQVANYLLKDYTTNEFIAETKAKETRLARRSDIKYAEEPVTKSLCFRDVYKKYALNSM